MTTSNWREERGPDYVAHGRGWDSLIERALKTLLAVYNARHGITIRELCDELGISPSTVYRNIATARRAGWVLIVRRGEDSKAVYRIAPRTRHPGRKRKRIRLSDGRCLTTSQIADEAGVAVSTVCWRLRHGFDPLARRHAYNPRNRKLLDHDGIRDSQAGWARRLGISESAMCRRIKRHPDAPEKWFQVSAKKLVR